MPELGYTKAKTFRWLRRDQREDGQRLIGESCLVEIRRARRAYECRDCHRRIAPGTKYGWRQVQRFRPSGRDGLYERVQWSEHYCPRCLVAEPLTSYHARLPRNRRRASRYRSAPELRRRGGA